jgi:hypothetical protein
LNQFKGYGQANKTQHKTQQQNQRSFHIALSGIPNLQPKFQTNMLAPSAKRRRRGLFAEPRNKNRHAPSGRYFSRTKIPRPRNLVAFRNPPHRGGPIINQI